MPTAVEELETFVEGTSPGDPYATFARLRRESPVAWSDRLQAWVVTRWADVTRCFEDEEHFGPMVAGTGSSAIYGRTILHMSGTEHRRKAAIVAKRIRSPRVLAGDLAELVATLVEECGAALPVAPEPAEVKQGLTSPVPLTVIAELMAMHDAAAFPEWYHRIVAASVSNVTADPAIHARGEAAREDLFSWLTPKIGEKRAAPSNDLLSDLCTIQFEGEQLSDDEVRSFCAFLLSAGIETTDRAMVNLCRELVRHPDQWVRLKADRSLVTSAVAEILRLRPPVQGSVRQAKVDVDLGGTAVGAGDKLILLLGAANHDDAVFPEPDVFDVGRFADNAGAQFTPVGPQRAFGGGAHTCTGSLLAKLEIEQVLSYLLDRFDRMEFAGDPPADQGFMLRSAPSLTLLLHA